MEVVCVTGGAGYIGSHACVELLAQGFRVVVVDNLDNGNRKAITRVERITGRDVVFYEADVRDRDKVTEIFARENIDAVMHFAALKAVGESVAVPLRYYHNNVTGTLVLCDVMRRFGVKTIVFSSSATVYGEPREVPVAEDAPLAPANPYGRSKQMVETVLRDLHASDQEWRVVILRYFNPVGAHPSGLIGEDPRGVPNNLVPFIAQVAAGKREKVRVFGDDYPTRDGTGIRDYIHVVDLVRGHLAALDHAGKHGGFAVYNLGRGEGCSVLEMIRTFEKVSGRPIPYEITARRPGDVAACYADPGKAERELGWRAEKGVEEMCGDVWRWQCANPDGYA